ncbi:MAG: AraC family transcriptional regulator [Saccharofermentans sp.]|jgi:AraC-like DNA-binding protein|nr:AraC family transcriptional regulator [Mageeibacillus sp.]MCI1263551.1 AraC family transcriptional regulator [Saccharofermentans sp.]MCI1274510.1 AraC family transcriptional regulator [Saccharofermentans sp.]MCI2044799.1 AraC family transcriptional regulator [Mageeibacillus sp.]
MDYGKEIFYQQYIRRENDLLRAPLNPELEFYAAIGNGDVAKVKHLLAVPLHKKPGLGRLSEDTLRNIKYHFTITAALSARNCIACGMEMSSAYDVSDFYIMAADRCRNTEDISKLHEAMCLDYAGKMRRLRKKKITSPHIAGCIDFIYDNLHTRITVQKLSSVCNLSPAYLSRLFRQQTGRTISEYINICKIETAKNMLIYSDYSPAVISATLAFPSQSYFTSVFRKYTAQTPGGYRARYHASSPATSQTGDGTDDNRLLPGSVT